MVLPYDYGVTALIDLEMGPEAWFTVQGDGKGGAKLRQEAEYSSENAGEAPRLAVVRVNIIKEMANGKLRAHICEEKEGNEINGWCSMNLLQCQTEVHVPSNICFSKLILWLLIF